MLGRIANGSTYLSASEFSVFTMRKNVRALGFGASRGELGVRRM